MIPEEKERVQEGERVFPEQIVDPLKMEVIHFSIGIHCVVNN